MSALGGGHPNLTAPRQLLASALMGTAAVPLSAGGAVNEEPAVTIQRALRLCFARLISVPARYQPQERLD
jgi:hypothetical protein